MAKNSTAGFRLNLDIGTPLHINIQGLEIKIKTKLIGMESWEYLIIKAPVGYAGIRNKMVEGNKVVVRYLREGSIFGFEAYILTVIDKPTSLLIIDYPRNIEEKSIRKAERKDCYIPCTIIIDNEESDGTLVDISTGGCQCVAPNHKSDEYSGPENGSSVKISFELPTEDEQIVLEGLIVNTAEYHAAARLGIKFSEGIDAAQEPIKKFLEQLN